MARRKRRRWGWVLLVAAVWLVASMFGDHSGSAPARATGHRHATRSVPPVDVPAVHARALIDGLAVRPRPHGTQGYDRDAFGSAWADTDHNGCNQRDDVLLRDSVPSSTRVARQGACDHDVLAGTWHDPYTGRTLQFNDLKALGQAEAIQIDHVVPLAEAWVSGAAAWSADRRETFANDLTELLAVDGPTNMSKGDGHPAAWRPRAAYQCTYAERWVAVKTRWHLAVDPAERSALVEMLGSCR
ncbi:MAG: HNH endonuclease family protein [Nocardioides sp.]